MVDLKERLGEVRKMVDAGQYFAITRARQYGKKGDSSGRGAWTKSGFQEALKMLLSEKNALYESLVNKLEDYPELKTVLYDLLFTGRPIPYTAMNKSIEVATMFGFVKNADGTAVVSNSFSSRCFTAYSCRKIDWGRHDTGLYAQHPKYHGMEESVSAWGWKQMTDCWNYGGYEGKPVKIYVYSAADEVELWLNGKSCGRAAAGKENRYTAVFEVNYEPGSLSAASFRQGVEEKHKGARWNRKTLEATGQSQKELRPSTKQAAALSLTGAMENRPPLKIRYCR